ncbi:MAG TPA: prepilin-type N-terminal cleavage/methylation domain-containing protein [Candidatus Saccharimonadales bacterium]
MTLEKLKDYRERGFTIVELLIVIVVIAILATLVITAYNGVQQRARDSKRVSDARAIQTAVEAYQSDNGSYPTLAQLTATTNTVKLDSTLSAAIQATPAPDATTNRDKYQYQRCVTGGAGVGAKIMYWQESGTAGVQTKNLGDVSGTCS